MKINCFGPKSVSGLGIAYRIHADALSAVADVELFELGAVVDNGVSNNYCHGNAALAGRITKRGRNIAYWMCESSDLQSSYYTNQHIYTDIWTGSTYCQEVLSNRLNREVALVPHCVTRFKYHPTRNVVPLILCSYDGYSRLERKNPIFAIQAIKNAFGKKCRVIFKIKNVSPSIKKWLIQEGEGLDIHFIDEVVSEESMDLLYSGCDIFFSPHASEGFGLQLLEAMAFGCKVVATNYGGNTDFMKRDNSYLVDYKLVPVTDAFFKGVWAKVNMDSAVAQLIKAADDDDTINKKAFDTALQFNMANTIAHTLKAL